MIKYRLKFAKTGRMCFVGHLDLIRIFQRAVRRVEWPVAFSEGFNPHQLIGVAVPLPIGMTGLGEYMEIELKQDHDLAAETLNHALPDGLKIFAVRRLEPGERTAASIAVAAAYEIRMPGVRDGLETVVRGIMERDKIIVRKKTKSGETEADIRPEIFELNVIEKERVFAVLSVGGGRYLKPRLLADYILNEMAIDGEQLDIGFTRLELLKARGSGNGFEGL